MARKRYLKFRQSFTDRKVNLYDMHKSKRCFRVSLDMLGEVNFQLKFVSDYQIFSFEHCHLGKKRLEVVGYLENVGGWG